MLTLLLSCPLNELLLYAHTQPYYTPLTIKYQRIVDVYVYGPSLPVLIKPDDPAVRRSPLGDGMMKLIEHEGAKMLSLGFVSPTVRFSKHSSCC